MQTPECFEELDRPHTGRSAGLETSKSPRSLLVGNLWEGNPSLTNDILDIRPWKVWLALEITNNVFVVSSAKMSGRR